MNEIYLASTGVNGEPLDASRAIMTTDTFPKAATCKIQLDGQDVTINGIAKGAEMIAPNMATMLFCGDRCSC